MMEQYNSTNIEHFCYKVHVQEMRMKEYLLPILVGAGVGFMVLVLFMSLLICCCCKRKMKRKMKMAKEMEKPPLQDGIFTYFSPELLMLKTYL
jgi:hypothetical protein